MRRRGAWRVFGPGCILRRQELCDNMKWQPNEDGVGGVALDRDMLAAAAPEGGPIAYVDRDEGTLDVYTASGRLLRQMQLPPDARSSIHAVGWSAEEAPLLVQSGSQGHSILVGTLRKGTFERFKITDPAKGEPPLFTVIRPFGVFLLFQSDDTNGKPVVHSLLLPDNAPPEQFKVDSDELQAGVHSVTCAEAVGRNDHDSCRTLLYMCGYSAQEGRLPVAQRTCGVFTVDVETGDFEARPVQFPEQTYCTHMALCPERERFALLLNTGLLWLSSADLTQVLLEVRLGITFPPAALQWCASTFVHMLFHADGFETTGGHGADDEEEYIFPCHWSLIIPAPKDGDNGRSAAAAAEGGDSGLPTYELIKWDLDSPSGYVLTTTEIDGLRCISDSANILFEAVPTCLESACHLRAQTVSSCLCRCLEDMADPDGETLLESAVKLDQLLSGKALRALPGGESAVPGAATTLSDVLEELLDAAALEYDPEAQAGLLHMVGRITELLSRNKYVSFQGHGEGGNNNGSGSNGAAGRKALDVLVPGGMLGVDPETVRDVARRLRMLNDVRNPERAGMLITLRQYQVLSGSSERSMGPREADVVIHRLINHGDFVDAARLMHYFSNNFELIAMQWAKSKVQQNRGGSSKTHDLLSRALRSFPSVETVDIAKAAVAAGNNELAVQLLQSEKHSAAEVLLLLQLGYTDLAVEKALGSEEPELVAEILLRLMGEFGKVELMSALLRFPDPAQHIFRLACECAWDRREPLWQEFCDFAGQHTAAGFLTLVKLFRRALAENATACSRMQVERVDALNAPAAPKKKDGDDDDDDDSDARENPTHDYSAPLEVESRRFKPFRPLEQQGSVLGVVDVTLAARLQEQAEKVGDEAAVKAWTMQMFLAQEQQRLADSNSDALDIVGAPLLATLRWMYKNGEDAAANELAAKFGTSERALVLAKLDAYSSVDRWDPLDLIAGIGRYGKNKTAPLGDAVVTRFIETAQQRGEHDRAVQLVGKLSGLPDRLEWYVALDEFQRAADAAHAGGSVDMLRTLRRRSQNPQMQRYIDEKIRALNG